VARRMRNRTGINEVRLHLENEKNKGNIKLLSNLLDLANLEVDVSKKVLKTRLDSVASLALELYQLHVEGSEGILLNSY
jgi:hypothetical protein